MNQSINMSRQEQTLLFQENSAIAWRFVILVLASIVLMMYDHRSNQTEKLRNSLTTAVAPLQFSVSRPIEVVEWVKSSFSSHQELALENTNLKSQLLMQKAEMQKIIALQKENKQLRALLRSSSTITGTFKVAQILAISVDPFLAQAVLDKGKNYNIYVGQPVLDATGVMGQVIQVGELTARVMLISDSRSAVPVQDTRSGVRAIVIGTGPSQILRAINVPQTADIQEGDELTTSGLDLRFPAGYPVGIVSSVVNNPGQHFANIDVKPAANLEKSRQVLLIWEKTAKVNQEARADLESMSKDGATEQRLQQSLSNTNM